MLEAVMENTATVFEVLNLQFAYIIICTQA